jgi:hypothetical protein
MLDMCSLGRQFGMKFDGCTTSSGVFLSYDSGKSQGFR